MDACMAVLESRLAPEKILRPPLKASIRLGQRLLPPPTAPIRDSGQWEVVQGRRDNRKKKEKPGSDKSLPEEAPPPSHKAKPFLASKEGKGGKESKTAPSPPSKKGVPGSAPPSKAQSRSKEAAANTYARVARRQAGPKQGAMTPVPPPREEEEALSAAKVRPDLRGHERPSPDNPRSLKRPGGRRHAEQRRWRLLR